VNCGVVLLETSRCLIPRPAVIVFYQRRSSATTSRLSASASDPPPPPPSSAIRKHGNRPRASRRSGRGSAPRRRRRRGTPPRIAVSGAGRVRRSTGRAFRQTPSTRTGPPPRFTTHAFESSERLALPLEPLTRRPVASARDAVPNASSISVPRRRSSENTDAPAARASPRLSAAAGLLRLEQHRVPARGSIAAKPGRLVAHSSAN